MIAIVDTGPLYAVVDRSDVDHERCLRALETPGLRMAELVEQYASFPLGGTDASVIALAERLDTDLVMSLDQRHMRAVAPRHCQTLRLVPG